MNDLIGILPAAGVGSRLGTIPCSKEIMPLGFQVSSLPNTHVWQPATTIETHLQALKSIGINKVAIIIGNAKFDIVKYLGNGQRFGVSITYFYQEELQGMPFALDIPYSWIPNNATVLFSMPDTLITPMDTMSHLVSYHIEQKADVTLGLFPTDTPEKFGMVDIDELGKIINIVDKPQKTSLKYMWGYAAWSQNFTNFMHDYLKKISNNNIETVLSDVFLKAIRNGLDIQTYKNSESHYHDIGTPESFQAAVYELATRQFTDNKEKK